MAYKFFDGEVDSSNLLQFYRAEWEESLSIVRELEEKYLYKMQLHRFLEELWRPLSIANKAIDQYKPWALVKEGRREEAMALLGLVANILALVAVNLYPFMPETAPKIAHALRFKITPDTFKARLAGELLPRFKVEKVPPLFPKIEKPLMKPVSKPTSKPKKGEKPEGVALISIDDFLKVQLKIGKVVVAEEIKKSKKLLRLEVELGEEKPRQIVAGIKEWYKPAELVGKLVCVVANLKPAKLMGYVSEGMLLAAKDEEGLALIVPEKPKKPGTPIK
jgi:methionyl-tRNA synthetase